MSTAITRVAVVTRDSAEQLGLAIGSEVIALVKASSLLLIVDEAMRIDALLDSVTPDLVAAMAQDLPIHRSTVVMVVDAVKVHHKRLAAP